jgi:hypothetical protein
VECDGGGGGGGGGVALINRPINSNCSINQFNQSISPPSCLPTWSPSKNTKSTTHGLISSHTHPPTHPPIHTHITHTGTHHVQHHALPIPGVHAPPRGARAGRLEEQALPDGLHENGRVAVEPLHVPRHGVELELGREDPPVPPPAGAVGDEEPPWDEAELLVAVVVGGGRWVGGWKGWGEGGAGGLRVKALGSFIVRLVESTRTHTHMYTYRCPLGKLSAGPATICRTNSGSTTSSE